MRTEGSGDVWSVLSCWFASLAMYFRVSLSRLRCGWSNGGSRAVNRFVAVIVSMLVVFAMARPSYALTALGGNYASATEAALGWLGYDEATMPQEVLTKIYYGDLEGFDKFKGSLRQSVLDPSSWYSTLDGPLFVAYVDAAREDVNAAISEYNDSESDSGITDTAILMSLVENKGSEEIPSSLNIVLKSNASEWLSNNQSAYTVALAFSSSTNTEFSKGYKRLIILKSDEPILVETKDEYGLITISYSGNSLKSMTTRFIQSDSGNFVTDGNITTSTISTQRFERRYYLYRDAEIGPKPQIPIVDPTYDPPENPTQPTPNPPTVIVVPSPSNTTPADYTPWLETIKAVLDQIDSDLVSLHDDLLQWFKYFGDYEENFSDWMGHFDSDYHKMLTYLRIIANKGDGFNIPIDPKSIWDILGNLLASLIGGLPTGATNLVDALNLATGKFPFCIPFDIALLAAFLVHEPVAPVIEYDQTFFNDGELANMHVEADLSEYDEAAAVTRQFELFLFALSLLLISRNLLEAMEEVI